MAHTTTSRKELHAICRRLYADNEGQMKIINELERNYTGDKAIWWYTKEACFYKMLNKALRVEDIDTLFAFRFFITDVYKQLTDLHSPTRCSIDCSSVPHAISLGGRTASTAYICRCVYLDEQFPFNNYRT